MKLNLKNIFKKNKSRKLTFKKGTITKLKKCKHAKQIKYRSSYEEKFIKYLEGNVNCEYYLYEQVKIPYRFYGKDHNYIPDFVVKTKDKFFLIEIKPEVQVSIPVNKAKFAAALKYTKEHSNIEFKIITEKFLNTISKKK